MKKKILSAMLTATMVMSMGMTAWAEEEHYEDAETVTFTKKYTAPWTTGNPEETFNFTVKQGATIGGVEKTIEGNEDADYPSTDPSIEGVKFDKDTATADGYTQDVTITLPTYDRVGIYYYTINETNANTAGVSYHTDDIVLKVTVIQDGDKVRVGAVHCEAPATDETSTKTGEIENVYKASELDITKNVTGLMGETDIYFTVKVNLTAPAGTEMKSLITVNSSELSWTEDTTDTADDTYNPAEITEMGEYTFKIKDGETIKLDNIPEGVTYTVEEVEADQNGYDTTIEYSDKEGKKIDTKEADTVTITNNKGGTVDTGVMLDSMPYILLLAVAGLGVFTVVSKKRDNEQF